MFAEKDLLEDEEVRQRFNALRYEEFKQAVIRQFGSFGPECHYDFGKRKRTKPSPLRRWFFHADFKEVKQRDRQNQPLQQGAREAGYGTGSRLMKAIPGVGKALGNAGEAIAGTDAAHAQPVGLKPGEAGVVSGGLTALNGAGGNSEIQALTEAFKNGTLTSKQIETLKPGGANRAAFEEVTGLQLPATSSETRRMLRAGPQVDLSVEKSLKELDIQTASWDEILNSPEIRQAREQAKFETPTIAIATPERQALRLEIANRMIEQGSFAGKTVDGAEVFTGPVIQGRHADIVIGPPAAGKSTVLANPLSQKNQARIIDSDMAKSMLPEFEGGIGASRVHEESALISEGFVMAQAIENGDNIIVPWVGKTPEKIRRLVQQLREHGYSVELHLNELDADQAARRAVVRFQNTGRLVDPEYVLDVGWKPSETYDILKQEGIFDGYTKYSNDVEYGEPAKLLERLRLDEVQTGSVGGYGGGHSAESDGMAYSPKETEPAEVGSQGNPAAFSVPETGAGPNIPAGMKERGFAESLRTQSDLLDEVKQAFMDQPEVYRQLSNAETLAKADGIIAQGLDRARAEYASLLRAKDPAAIPLGKQIADGLIAQGNRDEAVVLLREMSERLTQSGQFSQAAAIALMKNDPMTALQYIQKDIDKLNREGAKKFKKWKDFALTEAEIAAFGN